MRQYMCGGSGNWPSHAIPKNILKLQCATAYSLIISPCCQLLRLVRLEEAEVLLRRAHDILHRTLGKLHPHRRSALRNLGKCRSDAKHGKLV